MKLNNKGITLIEIIISITLISLVIVFLLSVLITVRHEDKTSKSLSHLKMNQALIIKEINTDFIERELIGIESCEDGTIRSKDSVHQYVKTLNNSLLTDGGGSCLKLIYNPAKGTDNIGYLLAYSYNFSNTNLVNVSGYRRGINSLIRETESSVATKGTAFVNCDFEMCIVSINLPILAENGDDYGINISYIADPSFYFETGESDYYNFEINANLVPN